MNYNQLQAHSFITYRKVGISLFCIFIFVICVFKTFFFIPKSLINFIFSITSSILDLLFAWNLFRNSILSIFSLVFKSVLHLFFTGNVCFSYNILNSLFGIISSIFDLLSTWNFLVSTTSSTLNLFFAGDFIRDCILHRFCSPFNLVFRRNILPYCFFSIFESALNLSLARQLTGNCISCILNVFFGTACTWHFILYSLFG